MKVKTFMKMSKKNTELLQEIKESIEAQKSKCEESTRLIEKFTEQLKEVNDSISSIPAEIIDIDQIKEDIGNKRECCI